MSRTTPIQFEVTDPQGLDLKISEIQTRLKTANLPWNVYSFARAYRFVKVSQIGSVGGAVITYPAVFQGEGLDYLDVFPNDNLKSFSFVVADQLQELKNENNGWHEYEGEISIILVFQLKKIGTANKYRFIELLKYDVIETLKLVPDLTIGSVYDDIALCYSDFSTSEIEVKYLSEQYGALRFDCSVDYSINCKLTNTY